MDELGGISKLKSEVDSLTGSVQKLLGLMGGTGVSRTGNILANSLGIVSGVAKGISNGMPDVGGTVQRAQQYYQGALRTNNSSFSAMSAQGLRLLGGGMSFAGADAALSNSLSNQGLMAGTSQYNSVMRGAGAATRYLNMDTVAAGNALAGLNSGAGSSMLMKNFGILTSDPRTGKMLSSGQIFEQFAQRATAGRGKATVAQTMDSLYRGGLGASIRNSGLDENQQALLSQYMIERSKGNNMDLSSSASMKKLEAKATAAGNENPFSSAYKITNAQTGAMDAGQKAYIDGIKTAADQLTVLYDASGKLAAQFGSFQSYLSTMTGAGPVAGAAGAFGSLVTGASNIATTLGINKLLKGGGGAAAAKGGMSSALGTTVKSLGKASAWGLAATVASPLLQSAVTQVGGNTADSSKWGAAAGGALSGAATGALVGSVIPLLGTGAGAIAGGIVGGAMGYFGGDGSGVGLGNSSGVGTIKLMKPTTGTITAYFGETGDMWGSGSHHGIDYGVPHGTPVYAAAAGKVSYNDSSALGNVIRIQHAGGWATQYAHLSQKSARSGSDVKQGDFIGYSGKTGTQQNGAHLHFELWQGGTRVNPAPYLGIALSAGAISANLWGTSDPTGAGTGNVMTGLFDAGKAPSANLLTTGVSGLQSGGSPSSMGSSSSSAGEGGSRSSIRSGSFGGSSGPSYLSGARSASSGMQYVPNDGPVNVHQGETILPVNEAREYRQEKMLSSKKGGNNVTINLSIQNASDSEAKKFAKYVKQYLEDNHLAENMGRR
ncbi:Peptidase M23 [uncultured Caudovirales phage]|uniref:Peptidase M23 n=1 Tax=uncultured Caudovirales phage TaxID=2100421 RepID=A0A6J5KTG8_9CAUD|nr:Peptidase M23 [uncultured Caudovirales phage]